MINTNCEAEVTFSDNSHLFGIPFVIKEPQIPDAYMEIPRNQLDEWIEKTINLPIMFHFIYKSET